MRLSNWRNTYRNQWTACPCTIEWKYLGHGLWRRRWPGTSPESTVTEHQMMNGDGDCWQSLKTRATR